MMEVRPYQTKCLDAMQEAAKNGVTRQLVVMATGLGKTVVVGKFLERMGFPNTYGIMHREELITQARDRFRAINPNLTIGFDKAEFRPDVSTDKVILATVPECRPCRREATSGGSERLAQDRVD
jgi:superfamily II DNA or RNA helicase